MTFNCPVDFDLSQSLKNSVDTLTNIENDISTTKKEINEIKDKNKKIIFDTYLDSYKTKHRKIDADLILENISAINTSNNTSLLEIDPNSVPISLTYTLNELNKDEIDLLNKIGPDHISVKHLLNELVKKNQKLVELEKELENTTSQSIRSEPEKKLTCSINEYNELKNKYFREITEKDLKIEKVEEENKKIKKEKEFLIGELVKLKIKNETKEKKYKENITEIANTISILNEEWDKCNNAQ